MSHHTARRRRVPFRWRLAAVLTLVLTALSSAAAVPAASGQPEHPSQHLRPVIFVHGGTGSGAQFESQAMRLTSNGYPRSLIAVHEYDSTFGLNTVDQVWAGLDQLIDDMLASSGADQVDLLGHSLGTFIDQGYLNSSPERAARVAHYVNIDGQTAGALPGGVPTLAVWGEGNQSRQIVGAQNFYLPNQSHVQTATSPETFAQFYEFFTGRAPRTTDVTRDRDGRVRLAGEANLFPSNVGAEGATLEIWEVNGRTGQRRGHHPRATFEIGADGAWGPFRASTRKHYEFAVVWGPEQTQHFYFEPFTHDDHLIRLLTTVPGTGLDTLRETSDHHSTFTVIRYKEWWGDQGAQNDVLAIDDLSVLNAANSPRSKRVNAIFAFDIGSDGVTDLTTPHPVLSSLPFLTGIDVFVPAANPPDRTVRIAMTARASDGSTEVINVPNWASSQHHISVQFPDF